MPHPSNVPEIDITPDIKQIFINELCIYPSNSRAIHRLGDIYKYEDMEDEAILCYRGILPECANDEYLSGAENARQVVASREASNSTFVSAYPSEQKEINTPTQHALPDVVHPKFPTRKTTTDESFVITLKDGEFWFDELNLVIVDNEKHILKEHVRGNKHLGYHSMQKSDPIHLSGRVCFLECRSTQVYYHFIVDMLSKLGLLDKCGIDSIDYFYAPITHQWQADILEAYGISKDKIIPSKTQFHYRADELIVPALNNDIDLETFGGMGLTLAPWIPQFHKDKILKQTIDHPTRKIFLSREESNGRGILKTEALEAVLRKQGFEIIRPENLSFLEQAQLMSESRIVIGAHGSALTNCIFCSPSTTLVEIFRTNFTNPAFWSLATTIGIDYHQYFVDVGTVKDNLTIFENLEDLRNQSIPIDVEHFASVIEGLAI